MPAPEPDRRDERPAPARSCLVPLLALGSAFLALQAWGAVALARGEHDRVLAVMLLQAPVYAAAAWLVLRHGSATATVGCLAAMGAVALAARLAILPLPPVSTDIYRYVWDGRVQAAGINPYRHVPADPALAGLRDAAIFPNINRVASAPTIYPPAAQLIFLAVTRLSESVTAMKAALVLLEALTVAALAALLRRRGLPLSRLLLYAWHPLPLWEIAGSGHIDAAATALMLGATWAADRRRPGLAGAVLALGAGVKYFPAFVAPALYRRFDWRMPAAFAAALALVYLPYLGAGASVLGYLPGYVDEEGLAGSGPGVFWVALVAMASPTIAAALAKPYLVLAGAALLAFGIAVAFRRDRDRVAVGAEQALLAAFILAVTPHYPWYVICLVPFLSLRPSVSVAYLTLSAPMLLGTIWPRSLVASEAMIFLPFVALATYELWIRRSAPTKEL